MTFMVEIMNLYLDKVDDCYYSIDDRHIYYNATNDDYIRGVANNDNFDWKKLSNLDSRADQDCDPRQPLELSIDWGSKIAVFSVGQERNFDFVTKLLKKTDNMINEFFVKPQEESDVMINAIVDKFCDYYQYHACKRLIFYRDKYGDAKTAG